MAKGVLYKMNATTASKSQAKKMNASITTDGKVRHANATTWYDNYPMEQLYTQTFTATWSQGWRGDGVRLDDGVWKGNILTGSTTNYRGMFGFNKTAIQNFLAPGKDFGGVQSAKILINCYETTTNGSPDVVLGKHSYTGEPSGSWNGTTNADWGDFSSLHVPNGNVGGYWVPLKPSQITLSDKRTAIGGIALRGASATNEDMGKFNGISTFTTKLEITVLK
jgi:hypothetical protein